MPSKITSKEVLICLNHLGYNNITAQQLKEFVQDLKKLIKYEERRRSKEGKGPSDYTLIENEYKKFQRSLTSDESPSEHNIFTALHSHGTCSSKAKVVPKKENVISLQIKKNKCQHHCPQHDKENIFREYDKSKPGDKDEVTSLQQENKSVGPSGDSSSKKFGNQNRPKSSFIRSSIPINNKSDPVALYHQYKAGWERHKVPGEDQRTELRWAIREKMLGGPRMSRA